MLFNSIQYLIFLPLVVCVYFLTPYRYRWCILLAASYYFYACWRADYLFLIVASTLVDYIVGIQLGRTESDRRRRLLLGTSFSLNLGLLFVFKYLGFFSRSLAPAFASFSIFDDLSSLDLLLPVGISFYTFQTLSYTIDVYQRRRSPERHLGIFAVYVAFFPQLVAGPIERSTRLLPQLREHRDFDTERAVKGLRLILWGYFKKVLIADRVAVAVNAVFARPTSFRGLPLLVATYLFSFQIFADFSAYSDIAIGSALLLGIGLMRNFDRPYFAASIPEFWSRWHISLTSWFKDYVYIPLGGNRVTTGRWVLNVMVVFLLSGLWHGANWTFVIWGAIHGILFIGSRLKKSEIRSQSRIRALLRTFVNFHVVTFAWIFFRADTTSEALTIVRNVFSAEPGAGGVQNPYLLVGGSLASGLFQILGKLAQGDLVGLMRVIAGSTGIGPVELSVAGLAILALLSVHHLKRGRFELAVGRWPRPVRFLTYATMTLAIMNLGKAVQEPFIYFQF